ncbi:MAG: DUF2786 domain-containing protein [Nanoarchaeota archaeon]
MNNEREKIMEKVNKLFRLSNSSNPHEASLALERAKDILDKYNLEFYEIEEASSDVTEETILSAGRISNWKKVLINIISKFFDCKTYYNKYRNTRNNSYQVVGNKLDILLCKSAFGFIKEQLETMANEAVNEYRKRGYCRSRKETTSFKRSFLFSAINEIEKRFDILKSEKEAKKGKKYSIMVRKEENIDEYFKEKFKNIRHTTFKINVNNLEGAFMGAKAGKRVSLNNPLENKA